MQQFDQEHFQKKFSEAQKLANDENKPKAVGCDSYSGYIIVDADDERALAELTDVAYVEPEVNQNSIGKS